MLPDAEFFAFSGSEVGAFASAAFANPEKWVGKDMRLVADWLTVREMAKQASDETGLDVRCYEATMEDLEKSRTNAMREDLYLMSMYYIKVSCFF
jgi:hypothetical protein